jgi:hypothetical protein
MTAVTEAAEGGKKLQEQKTLDGWPVAKVPQWSREGLMEHIVELVVVDDQVRKYIYVMSTHVQLACTAGLFPHGPCCFPSLAHVPMPQYPGY